MASILLYEKIITSFNGTPGSHSGFPSRRAFRLRPELAAAGASALHPWQSSGGSGPASAAACL